MWLQQTLKSALILFEACNGYLHGSMCIFHYDIIKHSGIHSKSVNG